MTDRELCKLGFMTRRFNELQGLRCIVPGGLLSLIPGLASFWMNRVPILAISLQLSLTAAAFWLMFRSKAYYAARVGVVEVKRPLAGAVYGLSVYRVGDGAPQLLTDDRYPRLVRVFGVTMAVAVGSLIVAGAIRPSLSAIATGFYLVTACCAFANWWMAREHRFDQAHYALLGGVCLALAARGQDLGLIDPRSGFHMAQVLTGGGMVICGLVDHWQLVHFFGHGGGGTAVAGASGEVDAR
jgi:hypothetical protein